MENTDLTIYDEDDLRSKIHIIHNRQVMIDRDLADIYGVKTGRLNEQVKRNKDRFPIDFCFQLSNEEFENWKSQNAISNSDKMGLRKKPFAFTELGVAMLSTVLKTETAAKTSVKVIRAFVTMRHFMINSAQIFTEINEIKKRLFESDIHHKENDKKIEQLFSLLEKTDKEVTQGIFFNGQIFDSFVFVIDLIKKAKNEIILIDNYVDETVLTMLDNRNENVTATIYTANFNDKLKLALAKHNAQYRPININQYNESHDRFLLIDDEVYHIGASIKDLGKSVFAFSRLYFAKNEIVDRL